MTSRFRAFHFISIVHSTLLYDVTIVASYCLFCKQFHRSVVLYVILYNVQLCSGTTGGSVLNGELYAQRFQKLIYIYLHLFTDCCMKISLQSWRQILYLFLLLGRNRHETVCNKCRCINFCNHYAFFFFIKMYFITAVILSYLSCKQTVVA